MLSDEKSFETSIIKKKFLLVGLCKLFEINYWIYNNIICLFVLSSYKQSYTSSVAYIRGRDKSPPEPIKKKNL